MKVSFSSKKAAFQFQIDDRTSVIEIGNGCFYPFTEDGDVMSIDNAPVGCLLSLISCGLEVTTSQTTDELIAENLALKAKLEAIRNIL